MSWINTVVIRYSQEMVRAMIRDNGENRNRTYRLKENE